jgi:transcriptional regulator with AAA-type ATPase domain
MQPFDSDLQALTENVRELLLERRPSLFSRIEGLVVREAFEHVKGNQVHAAALLGITRNEMRTLLQRHGLIPGRNKNRAAPAMAGLDPLLARPE